MGRLCTRGGDRRKSAQTTTALQVLNCVRLPMNAQVKCFLCTKGAALLCSATLCPLAPLRVSIFDAWYCCAKVHQCTLLTGFPLGGVPLKARCVRSLSQLTSPPSEATVPPLSCVDEAVRNEKCPSTRLFLLRLSCTDFHLHAFFRTTREGMLAALSERARTFTRSREDVSRKSKTQLTVTQQPMPNNYEVSQDGYDTFVGRGELF